MSEDSAVQTGSVEFSFPNEKFKEISKPTEVTKSTIPDESAKVVVKADDVPSQFIMQMDSSRQEQDSISSYDGDELPVKLGHLAIEASDSKKEKTKGKTLTDEIKRDIPKTEVQQLMPSQDKVFPGSASKGEISSLEEDQSSDLLLPVLRRHSIKRVASVQESDGDMPSAYVGKAIQLPRQKQSSSVLPEKWSKLLNNLPEDNKTEESRIKRIKILKDYMDDLCEGQNFDFKIFYCLATPLYRLEQFTSLCPLCRFEKKDNGTGAHPRSHIIPKCILKEFKNIHCKSWVDEFIYDAISNKPKGFESLAFPIFCHTCELEASNKEEVLKKMYLKISGTNRPKLKMSPGDWKEVIHILAVILFRGTLIGVDFHKEIKENEAFFDIFEELREHCINSSKELSNFRVFIAGNEHNSKLQNPPGKYFIELQLRSPQFTRMVRTEEGDVFLYSKFDCFHCVLLIKSTTIILPPQSEAFHAFPTFLHDYNLKRVGHLISHQISLDPFSGIIVEDPLNQFQPEPPRSVEIIPTAVDQIDRAESIHKCDTDELRQRARCQSPLHTHELDSQKDSRISELEKKISNILKEKKKAQSEQDRAKNELKNARQNFEKKRKEEKERSQQKIKALLARLEQLQLKIHDLEKERNALQKEKEELMGEIKQMKLNPLTLTMDKPIDCQ